MKNKDVIVISKRLEDIKRMDTIFALAGYKPFFVENLNQFFNTLEKFIPLACIIVESDDLPVEIYVKEIKKLAPLLPVMVAIKSNDLLKKKRMEEISDAILSYPQTEIELAEKLSFFESRKIIGNTKDLKFKQTKKLIPLFILIISILILPLLTNKYFRKEKKQEGQTLMIPTTNISGFFTYSNQIYIYDWLLQSFYIYAQYKMQKIAHLQTSEIGTIIKDGGEGFFFFITDNNTIEKRNKRYPYNLISSTKKERIKDICFDRMYVWLLRDDIILKALNDDNLSELKRYQLPYRDIEYIGCDKDEIYYYSKSKIYISSTESPSVIKKIIISPDKKIISFDYKDKKIRYIYQEKENSFYDEISIN